MPIVVQRCLGLSEKLYKYGETREIEVRLMKRSCTVMRCCWSMQRRLCHMLAVHEARRALSVSGTPVLLDCTSTCCHAGMFKMQFAAQPAGARCYGQNHTGCYHGNWL